MTRAEKVERAQALRARGLKLREIAEEMGSKISTVHAWLTDPDMSGHRARRERYRGVCEDCGAPTDGSAGPGKASKLCLECYGRHRHEERRWTQEAIVAAMHEWAERHGHQPRAHPDWTLAGPDHPPSSVVQREFGSWDAAIRAAGFESQARTRGLDRTEVVRLYVDEGLTISEIGARFGVDPASAWWHLNEAGVPRRSPWESRRLREAREQVAA